MITPNIYIDMLEYIKTTNIYMKDKVFFILIQKYLNFSKGAKILCRFSSGHNLTTVVKTFDSNDWLNKFWYSISKKYKQERLLISDTKSLNIYNYARYHIGQKMLILNWTLNGSLSFLLHYTFSHISFAGVNGKILYCFKSVFQMELCVI